MTVRLEGLVLLERVWRPDPDALAAGLAARYPVLGRIDSVEAGAESGLPHRLTIEGATVSISTVAAPYPNESLVAPVRLVDQLDPRRLAPNQLAYAMVAAEAPEDPELAEAFSALVTLVTAEIARTGPALAAFWSSSWRLVPLGTIEAAADRVMAGEPPRDLWISFAELTGERAGGEGNRCLMSFGLRHFAGREVEMAPAPVERAPAEAMARRLAERMIAGEMPADHEALVDPDLGRAAVLRLADRFLRPAQPAVVVVPEDSPIEAETLRPRRRAEPARGLVGRLFRAGR